MIFNAFQQTDRCQLNVDIRYDVELQCRTLMKPTTKESQLQCGGAEQGKLKRPRCSTSWRAAVRQQQSSV